MPIFIFSHYKSMATISFHSNQSSYPSETKNHLIHSPCLYESCSESSWNLVIKFSNINIIFSFYEISQVDIYELASVANNKIFFTKINISVTLATQVGEVAASQKLLKILTFCNYNQLYQHCLRHCKNAVKTLYADVTSRRHFRKSWSLLLQSIKLDERFC